MRYKKYVVLVLTFCLAAFAGCSSSNNEKSIADDTSNQSVYEQAIRSMDDSKYDEAIELLNQIPEYKDSQSKIEEAKKGKMQADFAKYVFNFIKDGEFYNPSKVRVLSASYGNSYDQNASNHGADGILYLQIQGTNRLGGTLTKDYAILIGGSDDGKPFSNEGNDQEYNNSDEEVDVPTINKMLKKYWEDYGID